MSSFANLLSRWNSGGDRAIPPLDGPLRQNDELESAWPVLEKLNDPHDLVFDQVGHGYLSLNNTIARYNPMRGGQLETLFTFDKPARGLAISRDNDLAVCLDGEGVVVLSSTGETLASLKEVDGRPLSAPTSVIFLEDGSLAITDASERPGADWKKDYLLSGQTGRIIRWQPSGNARTLAAGLAFPYGICEGPDGTLLFSQAWDNSVWEISSSAATARPRARLTNLPGIPARIRRGEGGGYWLSFLCIRSHMVEFLRKQKSFCREMMSVADAEAWIAPELYSSAYDPHPWKLPPHTPESRLFAPGQIGAVRRNGSINPWAPTRSYGLVVKLNDQVQPEASFHARANSVYHGLTSVCESQGALWIVCNGYGALLKYSTLPGVERASEAVVKRKTPRERIATFLSRRAPKEAVEKSTILEVIDGTKLYGDAAAIRGMNLTLTAGEIHALLGENGAGKSTLSKAIAGAIQLTSGSIKLGGKPAHFQSSADALKAGVAMVFQETSLVPYMTVAQNIMLGNERLAFTQRRMEIEAQEFLASLNFSGIDVTVFASSLGRGHKQIVEIARALYNNAKVIIFDEPTASLSPGETTRFFELLEMLKQRGIAIVFISHNLEEALDLADSVSIMRDGQLVATGRADEFSRSSIVSHMVGREDAGRHYTMIGRQAERWTQKRKILGVENLRYSPMVKNMSFSVYEGEVTCIAGLVGAGRSEMAKVVAGIYRRDISLGGKIYLHGKPVNYRQPIKGIRDGIVYLTEDRKIDGIFETMGIEENLYIGHLAINSWPFSLVSRKESAAIAKKLIDSLMIRSINMRHPVNRLSGGNQQKVVLGKALVQKPKLLIVDEPTRGVDVGAIEEIHSALRALAQEGVAVVVISSYLPEVLKLADRVLVARAGQIVAEFSSAEATEARIMAAALY